MTDLQIPHDDPEREFLEYWRDQLLDPRDPQKARWLALEQGQVARARSMLVPQIEAVCALQERDVLDLGCQTGSLAVAMAERGARVTGVDVEDRLLNGARTRARCYGVSPSFVTAFGELLPFARASFDVVTFIDVIEHVEDIDRTLGEIVRVLRPGGTLFLQGPNRFSPRWFMRDPHYQMMGISVLPHAWGKFYVTRLRGRPSYDVGVFPTGSRVVAKLEALGMRVESGPWPPGSRALSSLRAAWEWRFGSLFTLSARKQS